MPEWKFIASICAILLTIIGYIPYIADVLKGKTQPHIYSWLLFSLITVTAFALQFNGQAGLGSFATLASSILVLTVVMVSISRNPYTKVTRCDYIFIAITLISLGIWLVADQPLVSAIMITLTDIFAYGPIIRKGWQYPFTETPQFFVFNAIRFAVLLSSLETYSLITALYPAAEFAMQVFLSVMLYMRRHLLTVQQLQITVAQTVSSMKYS